ncbi:hypothetical protein BGW80DRAFT_220036 [Lactifluus volemus]|nr:hypothetical protein BGW80DRAFT_220036 [Lactifluus volemus]
MSRYDTSYAHTTQYKTQYQMPDIQPQQLEQASHHPSLQEHVHQTVMLAAGPTQGHWGPPAGDVAMQSRLRDPRHVNLTAPYYGMGFYYPPLPDSYVLPPMVHGVGIPQGSPSEPTHAEDVVPGPDRPYNLDHASGRAAPAQEAVPDPLVHHALPPDEAVGDCLRLLAIRLLGYPDSQIDMLRMEPGAAGRVRVSISFEMAVPDPLVHTPDEAARECLRCLAICLLGYTDSQTDIFRMGPGASGYIRVLISFETATGNVLPMN